MAAPNLNITNGAADADEGDIDMADPDADMMQLMGFGGFGDS